MGYPSSKAWIIFGVVVLFIVLIFVIYDNASRGNALSVPKIVTLTDYKLAYIPETEEVLFVDRKTNVVFQVLSKEVATTVFTLKAANIQQEYDSASKDSKAKTQPSKTVNGSKPTPVK